MDLALLVQLASAAIVAGAVLAAMRIIAAAIEHGEAVCDLRAEVHRLHAEYQARLAGIDVGDVEIVGTIGPDAGQSTEPAEPVS